jgi:oxaloacetate decarboxylase gamma subunit
MEPNVSELLLEGVGLMAVGMTIVFSFLLLLVGMLFGMSRVANRLAPPEVLAASGAPVAREDGAQDPRTAAVIAAALRYHRRRHGG